MPTSENRMCARAALALLIVFLVLVLAGQGVLAQHGCEPGNLIANCNFDNFTGSQPRQLPSGWQAFVLSGDLTYMLDTDTVYGAPSLRMWSDGGTFQAGVFTQVSGVQPGATYKASAGWFAPDHPPDDFFCRKLGIDPTGGTDAASLGVVWGPTYCGPGRGVNYPPPDVNIDVSAVAQSSTVTVFAYVNHTYSTGANKIFLDAVELIADTSQPVQQPPTDTPVPPVAAPAPTSVPPTALPTIPPTDVPTATSSPTPTATATATSTATPTETPVPTETYTPEPTATSTMPARPTATAAPGRAAVGVPLGRSSPAGSVRGLLWGGLGALGGAGVLGMALAILRRK